MKRLFLTELTELKDDKPCDWPEAGRSKPLLELRKGLRAGRTELLRALQSPAWPLALRQLQATSSHVALGAGLGCCAKHQLWRLAVELLAALPQPNVVCINATVSACERASAWPQALELFARARERGVANAGRLRVAKWL